MASTGWMPMRLWCGRSPLCHLPSREEATREKEVSALYFDSSRFADLRLQIRLELQETQQSGNRATDLAALPLIEAYLPMLLAIKRCHSAFLSESPLLPDLLSHFPPLFHGLEDLELLTDRLIGKEQRVQCCLPVELTLVLFFLGQLHAKYAEAQVEEATRCRSSPAMQSAEQSWKHAERFFRWSASYSSQTLAEREPNDEAKGRLRHFFIAVARQATILSQMCAIHRLSTHVTGLAFTEEKSERRSRVASVITRRALTIVQQATASLSDVAESGDDSRLSRQLEWCIKAYEVRWRALYYHWEMAIFQLDANPEIAGYFCDGLLKLRIPVLPAPSSPSDATFARFAQELQLLHHTQLTAALDDKKALLCTCRSRFGVAWTFQALDKKLALELLTVRAIGPVFSGEQQANGPWDGEEATYVAQEIEEAVAATVKAAIARAEANCSSVSDVLKPVELDEVTPLASSPLLQQAAATDNEPLKDQLGAVATTPTSDGNLPSRTTALTPDPLIERPASASHESSGWVTMTFRGNTLHFEKAAALPTAHPLLRDSAEDVALKDDHLPGGTTRRSKPRPDSSPCYLSSKTTRSREQDGSAKMWTPMRAPCALCERRFMRASLPGVVVMKRIYDLRRQWGVAVQDSRKLSVPSSMYATANVCLLCQELLSFETDGAAEVSADSKRWTGRQLQIRRAQSEGSNITATTASKAQEADEIALMIHDSILCQWHQQPAARADDSHLQDLAVNKRARQSSTVCSMEARNALLPDSNRCSHTKHELQPWWEVDLANYVVVHSVHVYLRPEVSHLYTASASNPHGRTVEPYPLHLSVSMKTGVGHDCDDILASCVSSSSVQEPTGPLIEWLAPPSTRGRFVRVQCENRAILHIERVHVFVAKSPSSSLAGDPGSRRVHVRKKLQRAAFCASLIASTASPATGSRRVAVEAEAFPTKDKRLRKSSSHKAPSSVESAQPFIAAAYFDPERAEKRRVSRLYTKFKSLLDARTKYVTPEHDEDAERKQ